MFPVVFEWGDAVLTTYALLMSVAFFVGLFVALAQAKRLGGLPAELVVGKSIGAFLWGLAGARLLFVLTQWPRFAKGQWGLWEIASGGVVFFGGFLGAVAYLGWSLRHRPTQRRRLFAAFAPALAFAHAVGRLGCFANGCCHGDHCAWPWAVTISDPRSVATLQGVPLHPTPLYEAVFLVFLGIYLWRRNARPERAASSVRIYLVAYGLARFAFEFTRGDSLRGEALGLSTSQWISIGLVLTGLALDSKPLGRNNSTDEN